MLKVALVGAGIMGSNHARVLRQVRGAELTHVVDADLDKASRIAGSTGAVAVADVEEVLGKVDAAVVAAPSHLHTPLGLQLLGHGVHVLMEKPIAPTVAEAKQLVDAAAAAGVVLQVGHVERYNPAVLELDRLPGEVVHLDVRRISPYAPRIKDGVILDLMIHDCDLVLSMIKGDVRTVNATARTVKSESEDLASALLTFDTGATVSLVASRIGQNKIRSLEMTRTEDFLTVDLLRQAVTINRVEHVEYLSDEGARYRQTGVVELPFLEQRGEPLFLELTDFVEAVTQGTQPRVTGQDGLRALELAHRISDAAVRS